MATAATVCYVSIETYNDEDSGNALRRTFHDCQSLTTTTTTTDKGTTTTTQTTDETFIYYTSYTDTCQSFYDDDTSGRIYTDEPLSECDHLQDDLNNLSLGRYVQKT